MNNDGWGQVGAGLDDNRIAGEDLQHYRQNRTADEAPLIHRIVRQSSNQGGPMKENMAEQLEKEKERHEAAMKHHMHHIERHYSRPYDSQHGSEKYKYE